MTTAIAHPGGLSGPETIDEGPTRPAAVLIVDDTLVDRRLAGSIVEKRMGLRAAYACNGVEAMEAAAIEAPAAVLTDLRMPEMDGLALVEALRERFPLVPVVLMTGHGSEEIALEALRRGAASYVPKRLLPKELSGTLGQVLAASRAGRRRQRLLDCETEAESGFVLESDPDLVPELVARLHEAASRFGLFDENAAMRVDVALHEALLNGIYHGNLEVSSDLRQDGEAAYHGLVARRRREPPYAERRLHVKALFTRAEAIYVIRDEGPGFDPAGLPDPTDPANLDRVGGRGLLLIRTFMDEVAFSESGDRITLTKRRTPRRGGL
jgi:CheY-like chemotaxis protein